MNHYGRMAMEHTQTHRPQAFSSIDDPTRHFTNLGEQVQAAITTARDEILGRQREGETIDAFRVRSHQAQRTAEKIVLMDLVWLPPEPTTEPAESDENLADHFRRLQEIEEATNQDW